MQTLSKTGLTFAGLGGTYTHPKPTRISTPGVSASPVMSVQRRQCASDGEGRAGRQLGTTQIKETTEPASIVVSVPNVNGGNGLSNPSRTHPLERMRVVRRRPFLYIPKYISKRKYKRERKFFLLSTSILVGGFLSIVSCRAHSSVGTIATCRTADIELQVTAVTDGKL